MVHYIVLLASRASVTSYFYDIHVCERGQVVRSNFEHIQYDQWELVHKMVHYLNTYPLINESLSINTSDKWELVHKLVHYLTTYPLINGSLSIRWFTIWLLFQHCWSCNFLKDGHRSLGFKWSSSNSSKIRWWRKSSICEIPEWMWVLMNTYICDYM